jgi:hypothetical protein
MTRQEHNNQSLFSLFALGKSVVSDLLEAALRPIARVVGRANSPLYQPFPDRPMDHPSAPAVVTHPQRRTARIIPFPPKYSRVPAVEGSDQPAASRSISITNILSYTGPFSSSASRAAIPRLLLCSLR